MPSSGLHRYQEKGLQTASGSGLYHQAGPASLRQCKQNRALISTGMNSLTHLETHVKQRGNTEGGMRKHGPWYRQQESHQRAWALVQTEGIPPESVDTGTDSGHPTRERGPWCRQRKSHQRAWTLGETAGIAPESVDPRADSGNRPRERGHWFRQGKSLLSGASHSNYPRASLAAQ